MTLEDLKVKYDKLQKKYGAKELDSIYKGCLLYTSYNGCFEECKIVER